MLKVSIYGTNTTLPIEDAVRVVEFTGDGLATSVKRWHKDILPKHFTTAGAREYGYKARSKATQIRKARLHRRLKVAGTEPLAPLVMTGNLRETVLRKLRVQKTGASASRRVVLTVPKYAYYRPETGEELTATTAAERATIGTTAKAETLKKLHKFERSEKRRKRIA